MSQVTSTNGRFEFAFGELVYNLSSRTHLMGILNVTPDSFSDGGKHLLPDQAVAHASRMVEEGADFVDVGGESTRPGSEPVSIEEELRRVIPVIERLAKELPIPISIDTYKSRVAEAAMNAGATIINDISGMTFDDEMLNVAARYRATVVIMHMQGTPKTMQQNPNYEHVTRDVGQFLEKQVQKARSAGIRQIMVDPGIGFGKNLQHNLQLIRELGSFRSLGCPILVGPSRKSFIGAILDLPVDQRLEGTAAAVTACILNGAHVVRVHDVKEMKRVARVADALRGT
ncbi:MAG TPA: dihydropteroate synthase [Bacteroidota bacterium]|nr:dihydropteroate synthase [Bacteroidota bacterium]